MKRFLRLILLTTGSFCFFWILLIAFCKNGHMFYDAEDYPNYKMVFNEASNGKSLYKTIILGDSRMMSFVNPNYFSMPDSSINFSLPGSSPIEAYFVLKRYIASGRIPNKIIVGFDPGHFVGTQIFKQGIPFDVLTKSELRDIEYCVQRDSNLYQYSPFDIYSYHYGYLPQYGYRLVNSLFVGNYRKNKEIETQLICNKGCKLYNQDRKDWWNNQTEIGLMEKLQKSPFKVSNTCDYYFQRLIGLCNAYNIICIVEQLPVPTEYPIYNQNYWHSYLEYIKQHEKTNQRVVVVSKIRSYPKTMFRDIMHANKYGSKQYSEELSKQWNL